MKVKNKSGRPHHYMDYHTRGPIRPKPYVWPPFETVDVPPHVAEIVAEAHPDKLEIVPEAPVKPPKKDDGNDEGDAGGKGKKDEEKPKPKRKRRKPSQKKSN